MLSNHILWPDTPSRDERLVPVQYSDIVKWELRRVDRRAAQSFPNILFKHKKLHKQSLTKST